MRVKSFFAASVGAALRQAREELGDDAVLMEARKAPPEARHLGACEVVVAAGLPALAADRATEAPSPSSSPAKVAPPNESAWLSAELLELRREVQRIAAVVARSGLSKVSGELLSAELAEVFSGLIAAELDAELAQDVVSRLRALGNAASPSELALRLRAELGSRFSTDAQLGVESELPRTAALVGPPGAGKTATLAKLAVRYGIGARKPTLLISVDSFRVASGEPLRSYAAILGAAFQSLESVGALRQCLEEHRQRDLILIDTPGFAPQDMDAAAELAAFLSSQPNLDVHLVLTASMKPADLSQAVDRFAPFRPRKLVFTRLDETGSFGPIVSQAARTGWPVSFLTHGQQIPEDLEAATQQRILDLVLGPKPEP